MREDITHLALEGDDLVVRRYQDSQDIADRAKMLREQPNRGDLRHTWSIPNVLVDAFYQEYCGDFNEGGVKPMDGEFWACVNVKMKSPEYRMFWCHDQQHQYRVGYEPKH